ncbi:hypothetical protein GpartN1_g1740.t1 [Galdieria partita]|uniref:3-oxo-5-alpha-steroid 4-dehydrogenase C-terminal domain-containing protein n=1 Tax=Galdieria partita TaxID=83374 RepID=A0A9C7PTE0_9RHOD|nr:hypothetical protein GpartN1_g1740.t1 [Galdieria partita]
MMHPIVESKCVTLGWLASIVAYICKYFYPTWSDMISYGRIVDRMEKEYKILPRNNWTRGNPSFLDKALSFMLFPRIEYSTGFTSFYAIGCIMSLALFFSQGSYRTWVTIKGYSNWLFLIHTSRRLYESLFVQIYSKRKMHGLHWLAGSSYYVLAACTFGLVGDHDYCSLSNACVLFVLTVVFVWSNTQQFICHQHLAQLRRKDGKYDQRYHIPYRGLFQYVACPHYLLEMIIYGVLVVGRGVTRNSVLNFIFVVLNLTSRSVDSWHWYKSYFGAERLPHDWHVLIPWVW